MVLTAKYVFMDKQTCQVDFCEIWLMFLVFLSELVDTVFRICSYVGPTLVSRRPHSPLMPTWAQRIHAIREVIGRVFGHRQLYLRIKI